MPGMRYNRVWSKIHPDIDKELDQYSMRLGLTKSSLIAECVTLGLRDLKRAAFPEDYLGDDRLIQIIRQAIKEDEVLMDEIKN
jgi:hypothetical protein